MGCKKKIVVFLSGGGSNFKKIHQSIIKNDIMASIELIITNNPNSPAIKYAQYNGLSINILEPTKYDSYKDYTLHLLDVLTKVEPDLILLAGYIKKLPNLIIANYKNKILNVHPSLLPKYGGKGFYGLFVHNAVINAKEEYSGATIHFVNEKYDEGPIIFQKKVKIQQNDTPKILADRILEVEHQIFPLVVKYFCEGKIEWINGKPVIKGI